MTSFRKEVARTLDILERSTDEILSVVRAIENAELHVIDEGEDVFTLTAGDTWVSAKFIQVADERAADYVVGKNTLVQYWDDEGVDIHGDEEVGEVKMGTPSGNHYGFPSSRIRYDFSNVSGIDKAKASKLKSNSVEHKVQLMAMTQSELADIEGIGNALAARIKADVGKLSPKDLDDVVDYAVVEDSIPEDGEKYQTCPQCLDDFPSESPDAIEGDTGQLYCSLECLNAHHLG